MMKIHFIMDTNILNLPSPLQNLMKTQHKTDMKKCQIESGFIDNNLI